MSTLFEKGHVFVGPEGQGYEITRDVMLGEAMYVSDFKAFGGAPEPAPNMLLPDWMAEYLREHVS